MEEEIKFKHFMPAQIRFSDVDQFGHVNNSVYFQLYDLAKTTYFKDVLGMSEWGDVVVVVANINANFLMPVFFSDDIEIETATVQLGNKSFTLLQRAIVKSHCSPQHITQVVIPWPRVCAWATREQEYGCLDFC